MDPDPKENSKFHAILGRALIDHQFREALIDKSNPDGQKKALREVDADDSDESIEVLNASIDALKKVSEHFDYRTEAA